MVESNMFELAKLIKDANGDSLAMVDAIWEAGYRQPERSAEQAAQITRAPPLCVRPATKC